jgi:hypothetical protein
LLVFGSLGLKESTVQLKTLQHVLEQIFIVELLSQWLLNTGLEDALIHSLFSDTLLSIPVSKLASKIVQKV